MFQFSAGEKDLYFFEASGLALVLRRASIQWVTWVLSRG